MIYCDKCGTAMPQDGRFCTGCGKRKDLVGKVVLKGNRAYLITMLSIYGIALLTCFICNLAVSHTLSWFFIVLCSIAIAFSVTNLPVLLKKHRLLLSGLSTTFFIYLLLLVCNIYSQGDWFFSYAVPIATFPLAFVWLIILIIKVKKLNWAFKISLISLLSSLIVVFITPWIDFVLLGQMATFNEVRFAGDETTNWVIGLEFLIVSVVSALIGTVMAIMKGKKNNRVLENND